MKRTLERLTEYNLWANKKFHTFITSLREVQLDEKMNNSFPSIRLTIYHIWDAEAIWYLRVHGINPTDGPSAEFKGDIKMFYKIFLEQSEKWVDLISSFTEEDFERIVKYSNVVGAPFETKISDIIQHVFNHSTFHRGQLITMMRLVGFEKFESTDFISFEREMKGKM